MSKVIALIFAVATISQLILGVISLFQSIKKGNEKKQGQKKREKHSNLQELQKQKEYFNWKQKLNPMFQNIKEDLNSAAKNYQKNHDKKDSFQTISSQLREMKENHLSATESETFTDNRKKKRYMPEVDPGQPIAYSQIEDIQEIEEGYEFTQEDVLNGILYSEIMEKPLSLR